MRPSAQAKQRRHSPAAAALPPRPAYPALPLHFSPKLTLRADLQLQGRRAANFLALAAAPAARCCRARGACPPRVAEAQADGLRAHAHGAVQALVAVGLGGRDIVLGPVRQALPQCASRVAHQVARLGRQGFGLLLQRAGHTQSRGCQAVQTPCCWQAAVAAAWLVAPATAGRTGAPLADPAGLPCASA